MAAIFKTFTITLGECVENHQGMQKLGVTSKQGFTYAQVVAAGQRAQATDYKVEFYQLSDVLTSEQRELLSEDELRDACVLIIRQGAKLFFTAEDYPGFVAETKGTADIVDKKAIMRGKEVNKLARWNLCYANAHQKAEIKEGKGTVLAFSEVPYLNRIRESLPLLLGDLAKDLFAELNYYYNLKTCGIGYHGDTERARVVGVRIGDPLPLHYQWYHQSKPIGSNIKLDVDGGDMYIMSQKAVGTDWKRRKIPTLRHAAGYHAKYVAPKE